MRVSHSFVIHEKPPSKRCRTRNSPGRVHGNSGRVCKKSFPRFSPLLTNLIFISSHLSPLTSEVVGAHRWRCNNTFPPSPVFRCPQGITKPYSRPFLDVIFPSLLLSSVFLSFLLLSLSSAELSSPCPRILRCGHTIWVSVSLPWLGDHHALQLHSGFCCESPRSLHGLCSLL